MRLPHLATDLLFHSRQHTPTPTLAKTSSARHVSEKKAMMIHAKKEREELHFYTVTHAVLTNSRCQKLTKNKTDNRLLTFFSEWP